MSNIFKGRHGPLLVAEIGGNHEGDFEYAKELARLAIRTGVDFVKFQIYEGDKLVSAVESADRNKHFKKFELTREQHRELASMVREAGVGYTASVWDLEAIEWIDDMLPLYKIGSGDLTAYPLIKRLAHKNKPIILSTGLSSEQEVLDTVAYIQSVNPAYKNKEMLAILQCTSMYPIPEKDAHLNVMSRLRALTQVSVGYSDHTEGSRALKYAVAMGAEVLEFHFTDERAGKEFRDHKVSLTPEEVVELIAEINTIKELQGDEHKKPLQIELDAGHVDSFRRAVYPSVDLQAGEVLTEENLTILRPNHGVDAREHDALLGKRLKQPVKKHQKLDWSMVEQ
jgi:N-acetylneuraminate synthase/N,N'-diacetyllegionaminate synthase